MNWYKHLQLFTVILVFISSSCTSNTNDPEFLEKVSGRYLYTEDEVIKVYANDAKLLLDWRGAEAIEPKKIDDDTFYVKEMNAKIAFRTNPEDQKDYLVFLPKKKNDTIAFIHNKVSEDYKLPSQYLKDGNYEKALESYLKIQSKDSLNPIVNRRRLNRLGYKHLREDEIEKAIAIFKINIALYPNSKNTYDSLAEGYEKKKDTVNSLIFYKKVLDIDSDNSRAKRKINELEKK